MFKLCSRLFHLFLSQGTASPGIRAPTGAVLPRNNDVAAQLAAAPIMGTKHADSNVVNGIEENYMYNYNTREFTNPAAGPYSPGTIPGMEFRNAFPQIGNPDGYTGRRYGADYTKQAADRAALHDYHMVQSTPAGRAQLQREAAMRNRNQMGI